MSRIARLLKNRMEKFIINTMETRLNFNSESKFYCVPGIHAVPLPDDRMLLVKIDGTGKFAVCGMLNHLQKGLDDPVEGDLWLFSRDPGDDGKYQTVVKLNHDGTLVINTPKAVTIENHDTVDITVDGDVTVTGKQNVTVNGGNIKVNGPIEFAGGPLKKDGSAPATGNGAFCAIKTCRFTGEPHVGETIS